MSVKSCLNICFFAFRTCHISLSIPLGKGELGKVIKCDIVCVSSTKDCPTVIIVELHSHEIARSIWNLFFVILYSKDLSSYHDICSTTIYLRIQNNIIFLGSTERETGNHWSRTHSSNADRNYHIETSNLFSVFGEARNAFKRLG